MNRLQTENEMKVRVSRIKTYVSRIIFDVSRIENHVSRIQKLVSRIQKSDFDLKNLCKQNDFGLFLCKQNSMISTVKQGRILNI